MSEGLTLSQLAEKNALLVTENAALQQKLDAVLAENVALKERERRLLKNIHEDLGDADFHLATLQTPVTDAILNEVRAEGLEMFAKYCWSMEHTRADRRWVSAARNAELFAENLRAGSTEGGV